MIEHFPTCARAHRHAVCDRVADALLRAVAAAFVGVELLSPRLIAGSVWISSRVDKLFAWVRVGLSPNRRAGGEAWPEGAG
jgi:hypothetical protein